MIDFFSEVIEEAYNIKDAYAACKDTTLMTRVPAVTVFLDEVNTATCLGLFKEIIVDKSIDGKVQWFTTTYFAYTLLSVLSLQCPLLVFTSVSILSSLYRTMCL